MISGSEDKSLVIWDKLDIHTSSSPDTYILNEHRSHIIGIAKIDNKHIVSGDYQGGLKTWDIDSRTCIREIEGLYLIIQMKKIEGENIVGCIFHNSFTLWDVCFWIHKKEFKLNYGAYVFEFLSENTIAIGLSTGGIEIIHLETGSSLYPRIELCSDIILNLVKNMQEYYNLYIK